MLELALERATLAPHPEQHPGENRDSRERGDSFERLLERERQLLDRQRDDHADRDRQADRGPDADRHLRQRIAPADLHEVGGDDPDDEGGLEALAEHEEERREHSGGGPRNSGGLALAVQGPLSYEPSMGTPNARGAQPLRAERRHLRTTFVVAAPPGPF